MPTLPNGFDIPIPFLNQTFHIYFYGILITLGVIAAAFLAQAETKRRGMDPEIIWDMLFWVVLAGIVGARIWHILTPPPSMVAQGITTKWYLMHPLDMINIRNGGLGIPGAVIGGALALWIYCRRKKISFLTWADVAAPGVALAQAIGRWGRPFAAYDAIQRQCASIRAGIRAARVGAPHVPGDTDRSECRRARSSGRTPARRTGWPDPAGPRHASAPRPA